jgi:Co/Zn/Cd efflux system component
MGWVVSRRGGRHGCRQRQHDHDHGDVAVFAGKDPAFRRVLWVVILLNAGMAAVEIAAGSIGDSMALQADALDFIGDAATYGLSLAAIGWTLAWRARAALVKGLSLAGLPSSCWPPASIASSCSAIRRRR